MSAWEKLAEARIHEALEAGDLMVPPAAGPLDLRDYFALPEAERASLTMLRQAGVIPPEVELLKRIGQLEQALQDSAPESRDALRRELAEARVAWELVREQRRRAARAP